MTSCFCKIAVGLVLDLLLVKFRKLGINVAYYRKLKGLTQIELAEMIQKSRTYVSQLEAPQMTVNMTIDVLFKIAEVLEVHPARLLE